MPFGSLDIGQQVLKDLDYTIVVTNFVDLPESFGKWKASRKSYVGPEAWQIDELVLGPCKEISEQYDTFRDYWIDRKYDGEVVDTWIDTAFCIDNNENATLRGQ